MRSEKVIPFWWDSVAHPLHKRRNLIKEFTERNVVPWSQIFGEGTEFMAQLLIGAAGSMLMIIGLLEVLRWYGIRWFA